MQPSSESLKFSKDALDCSPAACYRVQGFWVALFWGMPVAAVPARHTRLYLNSFMMVLIPQAVDGRSEMYGLGQMSPESVWVCHTSAASDSCLVTSGWQSCWIAPAEVT